MHSASISAGDRKSSPLGSQAWQSASSPYQVCAFARTAASSASSPVAAAYSSASDSAKAVLACVPARIGYVAFGSHSSNRATKACVSGHSTSASGAPSRVSSAASISSHAQP